MPVFLAAPPPATVALAQIRNPGLNLIDLHPSTKLHSTAAMCSSTTTASIRALDRLATPQTPRPWPSNPHSARGTAAHPPSRFPPLEVFRRRPPERLARLACARHPKTFTLGDIARPSRRTKLGKITRDLDKAAR